MWIKRVYEYSTDDFRPGDIIEFSLTDGEAVEAMAVKSDLHGTLFCLRDCLKTSCQMNDRNTNEGGYANSVLRKRLNSEILNRFPNDIRERMVPLENGDFLRLPTEEEIFGRNEYGEPAGTGFRQWEPMTLRHNRIALEGKDGSTSWYWLQNKRKNSSSYFCVVNDGGSPSYYDSWSSGGVRPAFYIC